MWLSYFGTRHQVCDQLGRGIPGVGSTSYPAITFKLRHSMKVSTQVTVELELEGQIPHPSSLHKHFEPLWSLMYTKQPGGSHLTHDNQSFLHFQAVQLECP